MTPSHLITVTLLVIATTQITLAVKIIVIHPTRTVLIHRILIHHIVLVSLIIHPGSNVFVEKFSTIPLKILLWKLLTHLKLQIYAKYDPSQCVVMDYHIYMIRYTALRKYNEKSNFPFCTNVFKERVTQLRLYSADDMDKCVSYERLLSQKIQLWVAALILAGTGVIHW